MQNKINLTIFKNKYGEKKTIRNEGVLLGAVFDLCM